MKLNYPKNFDNPDILFSTEENFLQLSGKSISSDPELVFRPLMDTINLHFASNTTLVCEIKLEYFNSRSAKALIQLIQLLTTYHNKGFSIKVSWYYENDDDDCREFGEDLQSIVDMPVDLIRIESF